MKVVDRPRSCMRAGETVTLGVSTETELRWWAFSLEKVNLNGGRVENTCWHVDSVHVSLVETKGEGAARVTQLLGCLFFRKEANSSRVVRSGVQF